MEQQNEFTAGVDCVSSTGFLPPLNLESSTATSSSFIPNDLQVDDLGPKIPSPRSIEQTLQPPPERPKTPPHRSHRPLKNSKRTDPFQFGQRYLSDSDDVFEYNAWDHVPPSTEHLSYCESQYQLQRSYPVSEFDRARFNANPQKWWDIFYKQKSATFFKDRKWLRQEFPVLGEVTAKGAGRKVLLEIGAGAGNTVFPILRGNANEELRVYAYDFSKRAVETIRQNAEYDEKVLRAEVWDVASEGNQGIPPGLEQETVDVVIAIFVFSALSPTQWKQAVSNIWKVLKRGGLVLFRDYGRGDLAQVRFKAGRWLEENFYVRGDGTRVYFFDKDELGKIWDGSMFQDEDGLKGFSVLNLDVDRRLIVNRQRRITMYRCWIQGRFQKPVEVTMTSQKPCGGTCSVE